VSEASVGTLLFICAEGEPAMATTYSYRCGGNKYVVEQRSNRVIVWVWGWIGQNKVGDARDLVEAMALIKSHAGSNDLKTA
jgi:hypothetical protein